MQQSNTRYLEGAFLTTVLKLEERTFLTIDCVNKLVERGLNNVCIFRQNLSIIPNTVKFGIFESRHAIYFPSPVIATDIESAKYLIKSPFINMRYFYVWDLDWLYKIQNQEYYDAIYNSGLKLIARNNEHAKLISQCWKEPTHIIEDFNHEEITKIFTRQS